MKSVLKNYIKSIILFEQKSNKYNIFIDALENSNKSDLLDSINQIEISNKLSSLKKYQFEWLLNYINSNILEAEGLGEIIQIVIDFDKYKNTLENKELSSYKSVNEIRKELEKPSKRQLKKNKRLDLQGEYEIVYEDDKIIIYFPHSEKASCEIANRMGFGGVTWCTAAEKSDNYFTSYSLHDKVSLYYILSKIDNKSNMDKISIGIKNNQIIYGNNVTVNSSNRDLNKNDLDNHFGKDYWENISNILLKFNKKYEKEHPSINHLSRNKDIARFTKDKNIQLILSKDEDKEVRMNLAYNPNIDKEIQFILSKDEDKEVRMSLAYNPNIDKEIKFILSKDENKDVRKYLASNSNLDKEIQLILSKDENKEVRTGLAYNPNIDKEIQLILVKDENKDIRMNLVFRSNIDKEIQLILSKDENKDVRAHLASDPNIDKEIQLILVKDENKVVRTGLAYNPNIDKEIQLILSKDENKDVRAGLAYNPNIDKEIQLILVKDENKDVRMNLVFRSNLDKEIQLILSKDEDKDVRAHLASNPNIEPEIRKILENE